jgi:hypothetical protein
LFSIPFNKLALSLISSSSSNMTASSNSDRILSAASLLRRSVSPPSSVIPMVVDKTAATSSAPHSPSPVGSSISKENPFSQQSGGVPSPTYSQVISSIYFFMGFCHFGYFFGFGGAFLGTYGHLERKSKQSKVRDYVFSYLLFEI